MFFVSDNHYFHRNIQKFCPDTRRGSDVLEMNELMIQAHNERVGRNDVVFFLGDFSFGQAKETKEVLLRLNGQKHFIIGNHDKVMISDASIREMFVTFQHYKETSWNKIKICMFHFPMREWNHCHYGSIHLFGHVHGSLDDQPWGKSMDVGIDSRPSGDMAPWHIDEIIQKLKDRPDITHHGD